MSGAAFHLHCIRQLPQICRHIYIQYRSCRTIAGEPLEYASTCFLPTTFVDVPLIEKREYNHDSTIYTFGLPEGKSLELPVCACILLKAPGRSAAASALSNHRPVPRLEAAYSPLWLWQRPWAGRQGRLGRQRRHSPVHADV